LQNAAESKQFRHRLPSRRNERYSMLLDMDTAGATPHFIVV
jgi:hypothetical protein